MELLLELFGDSFSSFPFTSFQLIGNGLLQAETIGMQLQFFLLLSLSLYTCDVVHVGQFR